MMQNFDAMKYASPKTSSSSRILYDVACKVCQDNSSGKHYGIFACDGCAGFFKRSIRRNRQYICKGKVEGNCVVDKTHRNQCRACRLRKCIEEGMNKDAVQHERGPRNSTLQRQLTLFYKEPSEAPSLSPGPDLTSSRISSTSGNGDDSPERIQQLHRPFLHLYSMHMHPLSMLPPLTMAMSIPIFDSNMIRECTAGAIMDNVRWAANVPKFVNLPRSDQRILLKASWHHLFVLTAAYVLPQTELKTLLEMFEANRKFVNNFEARRLHVPYSQLYKQIEAYYEIIIQMQRVRIDAIEYFFMRAIMLFKPVHCRTKEDKTKEPLKEVTQIEALHEEYEQQLKNHAITVYGLQPQKLSQIHEALSYARDVSPNIIEDIFFRPTIGAKSMTDVVGQIYEREYQEDK